MASAFQPEDLEQIRERGSEIEKVRRQLEILREPPAPICLERPCVLGDGIRTIDDSSGQLENEWRTATVSLEQFVPASGAATRMFSFLPTTRGSGSLDLTELRQRSETGDSNARMTSSLLENIERLPFAKQLETLVQRQSGSDIANLRQRDPGLLLEIMVDPSGLGLLSRPKGLLPFHSYPEGPRTAFEEHLHAACSYLSQGSGPARFHFTVSAEHEAAFREVAARVSPGVSEATGAEVRIAFSLQDPATDTIASDTEGRPVRDANGRLLFRPGGHGSLLTNLSRIATAGTALVILKNIDNIAPATRHEEFGRWKRQLTGHLISLRRLTFDFLERLEVESPAPGLLSEILDFLHREFALDSDSLAQESTLADLTARLRDRLDRPIRVCGVVLNTGEPGGGPFWVRRQDGSIDGQIVEASQIAHGNPDQSRILSTSSHFNPVDIVCSLHDRTGQPYDLENFVDPSTYFVARKEIGGRQVKVLERPGLWNGAMANWNTTFVEVPESTFSPVKTLFDLLRPSHQN